MKIIKCTNGVGNWEIDETHDTFDTYEEAQAALISYEEEDAIARAKRTNQDLLLRAMKLRGNTTLI